MILVTGGCFQGKTEYALEKFQISRDEAADGRTCPLHMIYTTKLLYHFHEYIKRCMEANQELDLEELERRNPDIVLVTNVMGWFPLTNLTGLTGRRPEESAVRRQGGHQKYTG